MAVTSPDRGAEPVAKLVGSLRIAGQIFDAQLTRVGRQYGQIVRRVEAAAREKHVSNRAPWQEPWPFAERKETGRVGEPVRHPVELQLSRKLVLLHLQIVAGKIKIQSVVIGPDMTV